MKTINTYMDALRTLILISLVFCITSQISHATSCSCSGGYPCSTGDCSPSFSYCSGSCGSYTHYEYTGICEADGFGGSCEINEDSCGAQCDDSTGCYGSCCNSGDCPSDYYYCVGDILYYRDYYCEILSYVCTYDTDLIQNCNNLDEDVCISRDIYEDDYSCSGTSCTLSRSFKTDCGYLDTSYGNFFCVDSDTSRRERYLGDCQMSPIQCYSQLDQDTYDCDYGCSNSIFEQEYQYKCTGSNYYYLQSRSVYGQCRIDGFGSWSNTGNPIYCNYYCDDSLDEDVNSYSYLIQNPCGYFDQEYESEPKIPKVLQNDTLRFRVTGAGTFNPNVVCYDDDTDGIFNDCYGSADCDSDIQNTYCDGDSCCVGGSDWDDWHNLDTSTIKTEYLGILSLNTDNGWDDSDAVEYKILSSFIDAEITYSVNEINKSNSLTFSSDFSVGSPSILVSCWDYKGDDMECYGTLSNCNTYCPLHNHAGTGIYTDYVLSSSVGDSGRVRLNVFSSTLSDTDSVTACWFDSDNDFYCGSCTDGIKNDDETDIDLGGHCGSCFNNQIDLDSGETYIDYGGRCGSCFDNKLNIFESEIDYGGLCGNCTGTKQGDLYWEFGHITDDTIPFDEEYCGIKTEAPLGLSLFFIIAILLGFLIISVFFFLGGFGFIIGSFGSIALFIRNFSKNRGKNRNK
jgi:hypothetical protein